MSLADPIRLGPAGLRNRVFVAPHTTNFGQSGDNLVTDRHLDYHRARARGGAGLIITEGIRVHPTSLRRLGVHAYDDEALPGLTALADTVHAEGAALFAQLLHTGRHSGDEHHGSFGAGPTPWSTGAHVPHAMNRHDIRTVVQGFADAARRVVAAGFDGMEVHLGHGHLLQQFLSPVTNHRTDAYGGSFAGRLRLARECVAAVRDAVDGHAAVGVRLSADEFLPGGLTPDDTVAIVRALLDDGPLDFLHVSHSAYIGAASLATQMADMSWGTAPFRDLPARFSREFPEIPVLAICRIDDLATGQEILDAGEASMVGFARAHIADPALASRPGGPAAGRALPITPVRARSCIACNQGCNANLEAIVPITCTVNPAVGRERAWDDAAAAPRAGRRILVVGAGPAGLEAAITADLHGHEVRLVDTRDAVGGGIRSIVRAHGRERFGLLLEDLEAELSRSTVDVVLGTTATAADIVAWRPDVVVLATGALPDDTTRMPLDGTPVLDAVDVLADPSRAGRRCVVLDETGTWEASAVVSHLAGLGVDVHLVSPTAAYAAQVTVYSRLALGERLTEAGVAIHTLGRLASTGERRLEVRPAVGTAAPVAIDDVDAVVHVRPALARTELFDALEAAGFAGELHLVGDAFAPRTVQEAVYEGRAAATVAGVADAGVARGIGARAPYALNGASA
ncbi:FAD-dependent oxidoreductase [Agromyces sp. SYSU T00194]|uniref:oxidoreductase n=1 Tax=Agromyces chitinivorans TaxID=3158560 RepID=UPI003390F204